MPELSESIDALCAQYVHEGGPGLALAVIRDGAVLYRKAFGLANLEHDVPNTVETVFETASVSKQVTAFAVHLLIEDGKLSLDDDVRDYVPDVPDFGTPVTVRHCLHHTCGFREWGDSMGLGGRMREDVWEPELVMRWLSRQRALNHSPGAEFQYSNTGYFVLAAVVAAAAGESFASFCKARIFDPLGMTNTHFRETLLSVIKNRADSYFHEEDGTFAPCLSNQALPGATSMQTTLDDMILWLNNFETARVGGADLLAAMHEPGVLNNGQPTRYGSGIEFGTYRGHETVYHTGGWACFCSLLFRIPSQRLAIAQLSNTCDMNSDKFWPPLVDLLLGESSGDPVNMTRETESSPSVSLSELTGLYVGPGGPVIEISEQDGVLRTGAVGQQSVGMRSLGGLRFRPDKHSGVTVEFFHDARGDISRYIVTEDGIEQPPRNRVEPVADAVNLTDFAGTNFFRRVGGQLFAVCQG